MKLSRLGLGVVSILVIFASAAAIIGSRHAYRHFAPAATVAGAAPAGVRVNGSQPRIPPPVLRLSGEVVELAAGAPLTVTAIVGANTFPATVQGNTYTVYIRSAAQEMITVEARSPRVHYRSVVGSAGRLRTLAGSDAHLTLAEQPSLRVSPYSTALGWLVRYALGGRDAIGDAEFEKASRTAVGGDLEYAAYALAAIAKQEIPLPDGYTDGYQVLSARDVFRFQIVALAGFREAAAGYLFERQQIVPVAALNELPDHLVFLDGLPRGQLPIYVGDTMLLDRRSDGKFDLNEQVPLVDPIHSLAVDGQGRIQLTPVGAQIRPFAKYDANGIYKQYDRTEVGRTLKRLTRGDATSVWALRSVWSDREYLNPSAPSTEEVDYRVFSSTELQALADPQGWALVAASSTNLPWMCSEPPSPEEAIYGLSDCGYFEHRFETGGTGHTVDQGWKVDSQTLQPGVTPGSRSFNWSTDPSRALNLSDGRVATSFWRIVDYSTDVGAVFFHSKAVAGAAYGRAMVGINMTARKNFSSWTMNAATGDWRSGSQSELPHFYTSDSSSYFSQRMASGAGQETYGETGGAQSPLLPFSWEFAGNAVYDRRVRAFYDGEGEPYVSDCDAAEANGAVECHTRVRYFKPTTRIGNGYYGIEDLYTQLRYAGYPSDTTSQRLWSRLAYYECKSGLCLSASNVPWPQGVRNNTRVRAPGPWQGLRLGYGSPYPDGRK